MSKTELSKNQRKHLASMGHHLSAIVMVGKDGVTKGVVAALDQALWDHELVKVKVGSTSDDDRFEVAEELAQKCSAHLVKVVGKTMILYKKHPEKPVIKLPKPKK